MSLGWALDGVVDFGGEALAEASEEVGIEDADLA